MVHDPKVDEIICLPNYTFGDPFMVSLRDDKGAEENHKSAQTRPWRPPIALGGKLPKLALYLPLVVPSVLFLVSLYIPPRMHLDSGMGFLALRSMLEGGAFNSITAPDPDDIANDSTIFLTSWTPGQYLAPGSFIWLGVGYGFALSLITFIATIIGVVGWVQIARTFAVSSFVLFLFVFGLNTFAYVTLPFREYNGGELLLFAVAPWSLYAMRWAASKPPILCFTVFLLSAALLFFAKLIGLLVFATNVVAITLRAIIRQRRLDSSIVAAWVASAIGALCFMMFWVARGPLPMPQGGWTFSFSWLPIWFSVTSAALSGIAAFEFLYWFLQHPRVRAISEFSMVIQVSYVLGPLVLLLMAWVWLRLRHTRYRDAAVLSLTIILVYAIALAGMFLWGVIPFEERYSRYAGIVFLLLLLTAVDQWGARFAKGLACVVVLTLGLYGLKNSVTGAYAQMREGYYDPMTGISQDLVSPAILEYLRSEISRHDVQRPIALTPSPAAALSLPRFRILHPFGGWAGYTYRTKWVGRAEKVFVVLPEEMGLNGKAEAILRMFISYELDYWKRTKLDGMIIYTQ
jgi:hypothetical protein